MGRIKSIALAHFWLLAWRPKTDKGQSGKSVFPDSLKGEQYENGTIPTDDNPPVEELDPTKIPGVEEGELIPQEEKEEETVDPKNDPSVEVVKTETVSIEDAIEKASEE